MGVHVNDVRKPRTDNAAEMIAQSADRLRASAAQIRDPKLARFLGREATRLHWYARWVEQKAKRHRDDRRKREELERQLMGMMLDAENGFSRARSN